MIKPSRKYKRIVRLANIYDILFMKNRAIKKMESALDQQFTDWEKSSAYIYVGLLYADLKQYKKASDYFHKELCLLENQEFSFSPNFIRIIQVFIRSDELEKANHWLDNFKNRIPYDKQFNRLGNINSYFKKKN